MTTRPAHPLALLLAALLFVPHLCTTGARAEEEPPPAAQPEVAPPAARPFLWMSQGTPRVFLFGTVHVPDERVTTLAPCVEGAFAASTRVLTEIPMDPASQMRMMPHLMLPPDTSLKTLMGTAEFERLVDHLGESIPAQVLERFKPWAADALIQVGDYLAELQRRPALDALIEQRAKKDKKETGALETPEEQIAVFDHTSLEQQARLLVKTMDYKDKMEEEGRDAMEELILVYLRGDMDALMAAISASVPADDEAMTALWKRLLVDRNALMTTRLLAQMKEHPEAVFFVAVGAAHLGGPTGLVTTLTAAGHKMVRIEAQDTATPASGLKTSPAKPAPAKTPEPAGVR